MINIENLCYHCMSNTQNGVCTKCGFNNNEYTTPHHHLKAGTILNGKYVLGASLGEGGFGITYVGYDLNLELKVAIKEYFPNGLVSRDVNHSDAVTVFSGSDLEYYNMGREKFINEAKALAKCDSLPGVVSVKDFFNENGTAYIVMEFIEGENLKHFLQRNGGRVEPHIIINMMKPLIESLIQVHNNGIIHRDISPDNIMITKKSEVKLLDFGAAREVSSEGNKSLSIQLKPGYAPEEQYRTHGEQGPWTDVYALCATIYRAITGKTPLESLERLQNDTMMTPSAMGVKISPMQERAIMCGMEVSAKKRFRNMGALYNALYGVETQPAPVSISRDNQYLEQKQVSGSYQSSGYIPPVNTTNNGVRNTNIYNSTSPGQPRSNNGGISAVLIGAVAAMLITMVVVIIFLVSSFSSSERAPALPTETPQPTATIAPAPVFENVSASSTRGPDYTTGVAIYYHIQYICDGDYSTSWTCDRDKEFTPTVTFSSTRKQHVSGLRISNGYFKSESTYTKNRRITKILVSYDGGSRVVDLNENSYRIMQNVVFDTPVDTSYVSIKVLDSVYGKWNDVAISEVEFY